MCVCVCVCMYTLFPFLKSTFLEVQFVFNLKVGYALSRKVDIKKENRV